MPDGANIEIEGGLGEMEYGGITLNAVDTIVEFISKGIVAPEVQRRINDITYETRRSIKVKREGFFDPRAALAGRTGPAPVWSVYSDPNIVEHPVVLEYAYGGRNAIFRPSARARKVKAGIRAAVQLRFGKEMRTLVRNAKRRRVKK
jgi:hypothetical protein